MKTLSLKNIKQILREEVRKSVLYSYHILLETKKYDSEGIKESFSSVIKDKEKIKQKFKKDLKTYEGILDLKLEKILQRFDIDFNVKDLNYKQLRGYFLDLYLLRFEFTMNLKNKTGITDDDFRKEVEQKLKVQLFPDHNQKATPNMDKKNAFAGNSHLQTVIENFTPEFS